jgi:5-formyltetrahydrofolate cyclo-ligase
MKSRARARLCSSRGDPKVKQLLRREMLARRGAMAAEERKRLSAAAQGALIQSDWFLGARLLLLYSPFRGETETSLIVKEALRGGKRLALPRVEQETRRLWLHAWSGAVSDLCSGAFGILEPGADGALVEPGAVDLVVVPGVAFDRHGTRLGYGGGYFDRTLPMIRRANPAPRLIGLGYGFQVVPELPRDPHDIPVDAVATEAGLIRCGKA